MQSMIDTEIARQMAAAPRGAVFIARGDNTSFAQQVARHIARDDLRIEPRSALGRERIGDLKRLRVPAFVLDAALVPSPEEEKAALWLNGLAPIKAPEPPAEEAPRDV